MQMKTTLLIATYNWPEALRLVLESAFKQTVLPDEIVIADDGSGSETRTLIEEMTALSPVPIKHVWHEDKGFRLAMIRNKAVASSSGDYILQIDGDCILSPHYVEDHLEMAKPGYFAGGRRVMLDERMTKETIESGRLRLSPLRILFRKKGLRYLKNMIRITFLRKAYSDFLTRKRDREKNVSVYGASFSFWKEDFIAVNGYDETMEGWGWEDSDINARLLNLGRKGTAIRFGGYSYHLFHRTRNTDNDPSDNPNYCLMMEHIRDHVTRIEDGIDKYL